MLGAHTHTPARHVPRARGALARTLALVCATASILLCGLVAVPAASAAISITGNAYDNSNFTIWAGCGAGLNIGVSVNGGAPVNTTCSPVNGQFTLAGINTAANQVIAIYFNNNGGDNGIVYTRPVDNVTNITGIELYNDEAVLRSETATGWTNANLEAWDQDNDPNDVPVIITGTALTADPELRVRVNVGDTYTPTGNVTVPRLWVEGTYNGAPGETLTFTDGGNSSCTNSSIGSTYAFCSSGTFNAPPVTRVASNATTSLASGVSYQTLDIQPSVGGTTIGLGYSWTAADSSAQTLTIGSGVLSVTASAQENVFTVTGTTTINALATLSTANGGEFEAQGNVTGAGATGYTTGGTFRIRANSGATVLFGSTSGASDWRFQSLELQHSGAAVATVRATAGGTGRFYVDRALDVGLSSDASHTIVDFETNDRVLEARNDLYISEDGTLQASSTALFSVGGDFTRTANGVFSPGTGTVVFNNASRPTEIDFYTTGQSFYNVSVTTPAKVVRFDNIQTTTITNDFTANGGACGTRVGIASIVEADAADITVSGTSSIQYADVRDSTATVPLTATNSTQGLNNTNWTITGACATVTISGRSFEDSNGTVWSQCDGVTPNMALSVNGYGKALTPCSPIDGSYAFNPVPDPGLTIIVYQDRDGTPLATGATYTLAPAPIAGISNFDVIYGEVHLRSESGAPITSEHINMYDYDVDPTLGIYVVNGYYALYLDDGVNGASDDGELHVEAGVDFRPNHLASVTALDLRGTVTNTYSYNVWTVTGAGTSTDCSDPLGTQMPICAGAGGGFNEADGNDAVVLTSDSPYAIAAMDYPSLHLLPSPLDNPGVQLGGSGNGTLRVQGEFDIGGVDDLVVDTTTYSPYVHVDGASGQIGDLSISTGSSLIGTSNVRVDANMVGGGAIDMSGGTFENVIASSSETSDNIGPAGAGNHQYNNLTISTLLGVAVSPDFQASAGTVRVRGDLQVGKTSDTSTTTLTNNAINETIDVDGSVLITNRGSLSAAASPATPFTIGDDFTKVGVGTFTGNGGTVTFDTVANISTISTSSPTTFSNITATTPNKTLRLQHGMTTTVTGTLTANGGDCGSPVVIESTLGGTAATVNMGVSAVQFASLRDSTAAPGRNATTSANLGGNTGWTFVGGCAAPTTMLSHDTDAAGLGVPQHPGILVDAPHFSWVNNSGLAADRQRTQLVNTPVDPTVIALWANDGNGNDAAGGGGGDLALSVAPNDPAWNATSIQPGFGQSLAVDGDDAAIAAAASTSLDLDTFTVEAWVRISSLTGAIGTEAVLVTKDSATTNRNFRLGVLRSAATTGVAWADVSAGGAAGPVALQGTTDLDDGQWHHVAYSVDSGPADPNKVQTLIVDGVVEATGTFSGNIDNTTVPVSIGASSAFVNGLDGRIDDVRISSVVRSAAELKGYVRSRMPHGTVLWDSDPTDAGVVFAPNCNNAARCVDVTYAGPPLVRDGARYYVRGKLRSTTAIWSGWSTWDWFQATSGLTLSIPSGATEAFGTVLPGADATMTSDVQVWTNDRNGYTLHVRGPDDTWGLDGPGAATVARFTAPPDAPAPWPALTPGYFGFTVLAATGGKDTATWGAGATETSFGTLNYVGLQLNRSAVAHRRNSYSLATDIITTSYRANVDASQSGGAYTATIEYTAIPNV